MKKVRSGLRCLLPLLAIFICLSAQATEPLTPSEALQRAATVQPDIQASVSTEPARIITAPQTQQPAIYIFRHAGPDGGLLFVSASPNTKAVIGFTDGDCDPYDLPQPLMDMLQASAFTIGAAKPAASPSRAASTAYTIQTHKPFNGPSAIAPLCSTWWGQNIPFYNQTPIISSKHAKTGCVATAMAQLMKVHQYPASSVTIDKSYTVAGTATSATNTYTFDWSNMLNDYGQSTSKSSGTTAQNSAVAALMMACGQSVAMKYTSSGSTANIVECVVALSKYFNYSKDVRGIYKEFVGSDSFKQAIYNDLAAGRPVLFAGKYLDGTTAKGHAFVCDGYKNGTFHFNFGWQNTRNSASVYFDIDTSLQPAGSGGEDMGNYSLQQRAIVNIRPQSGGTPQYPTNAMNWYKTKLSDDPPYGENNFALSSEGKKWAMQYTNIKITPKLPDDYCTELGLSSNNQTIYYGMLCDSQDGTSSTWFDAYNEAELTTKQATNMGTEGTLSTKTDKWCDLSSLSEGIFTIWPAQRVANTTDYHHVPNVFGKPQCVVAKVTNSAVTLKFTDTGKPTIADVAASDRQLLIDADGTATEGRINVNMSVSNTGTELYKRLAWAVCTLSGTTFTPIVTGRMMPVVLDVGASNMALNYTSTVPLQAALDASATRYLVCYDDHDQVLYNVEIVDDQHGRGDEPGGDEPNDTDGYTVQTVKPFNGPETVTPLCQTWWGQKEPFYNSCPKISNTATRTGCVATAMAQIMKVHEWPTTQVNVNRSYKTVSSTGTTSTVAAADHNFTFDWDNMIGDYGDNSTIKGTATQKTAVADLMYACGISVGMKYKKASGSGSSEATMSESAVALPTYFGYDNGIRALFREFVGTDSFKQALYDNLMLGQPCMFGGAYDNNGSYTGHAFVCDGYRNGMFHYNFGWNENRANENLYFDIDFDNSAPQGSGGEDKGKYCLNQRAVINIRPLRNSANGGLPQMPSNGIYDHGASYLDDSQWPNGFGVEMTSAKVLKLSHNNIRITPYLTNDQLTALGITSNKPMHGVLCEDQPGDATTYIQGYTTSGLSTATGFNNDIETKQINDGSSNTNVNAFKYCDLSTLAKGVYTIWPGQKINNSDVISRVPNVFDKPQCVVAKVLDDGITIKFTDTKKVTIDNIEGPNRVVMLYDPTVAHTDTVHTGIIAVNMVINKPTAELYKRVAWAVCTLDDHTFIPVAHGRMMPLVIPASGSTSTWGAPKHRAASAGSNQGYLPEETASTYPVHYFSHVYQQAHLSESIPYYLVCYDDHDQVLHYETMPEDAVVTGINDIQGTVEAPHVIAHYDLQGRIISPDAPGLHIVRLSDSTALRQLVR